MFRSYQTGAEQTYHPQANITLLIATGFHRATTREELVNKFGEEIVCHENIVIHDSSDRNAMTSLGTLPSGAPLLINKIAADADLLVSEGFIETHFFAARCIQQGNGTG